MKRQRAAERVACEQAKLVAHPRPARRQTKLEPLQGTLRAIYALTGEERRRAAGELLAGCGRKGGRR